GKQLSILLLKNGYEVSFLGRKKNSIGPIRTYEWNLEKKIIDEEAVLKADHIIHLAGATVAKRWTKSYKQEIIDSRVKSAALIFDVLKQNKNHVKSFISSSAVGFYEDGNESFLNEDSPSGKNFLSQVCLQWEAAANKFSELNKRVAIIRTGIVLANEGGSFPELYNPIRFGVAPIFDGGNQFYPWLHIDDLCKIYLFILKNQQLTGVYNACAPAPVKQIELMNAIANAAQKRKINIPVPSFVLKIMLGEFADSLSSSLRCSSKKIEAAGFQFQYTQLSAALESLLAQRN
ncbi:MAG: TIGR01777 family oxidoreductase, partial [Chitinophagales bacterium]|nr:TIGR01777 family oxidoreductase [Chitinophagales bacterium]